MPEIAQNLEKDLMSKRAKNCAEINPSDLIELPTSYQMALFSDGHKEKDAAKCLPLSTLSVRIAEVSNRLTLLEGFEKLKNDLKTQKVETASANKALANEAGKDFKENLQIASDFYILLNTVTPKDEMLLPLLQAIPEAKRSSAADLNNEIKKFCEKKSELVVCQNTFSVSEASFSEINELLKKKITDKQIEEWQNAMAIAKKDGSEYSFAQMKADLDSSLSKIGSTQTMSASELKAIQSLPDFENKKSGLKFIDNMAASKKEAGMDNQITKSKFDNLVDELRVRQQEEIKSKISLIWLDYNDSQSALSDEEAAACSAHADYANAPKCVAAFEKMAKTLEGGKKAQLLQATSSLKSSLDYVDHLGNAKKSCAESSESCEKELTGNKIELLDELAVLKKLEERIVEENKELKTLRNFAIESLDSQKCLQKATTYVGECDAELTPYLSREAESLAISGAQIAMVYTLPKDEADKTNIDEICDNKDELKLVEEQLCKVRDGESINKTKSEKPKTAPLDLDYHVDTDPGTNYNPTRAAITQGLSNIFGQAANMLRSSMSPYPQYSYMNPAASRPLSISDSVIRSAQVQSGYGVYSAYTPSMSRYFSK